MSPGARARSIALGAALLAALGCAPDDASPLSAVVVAWDPGNQAYELAQVKITTLASVRTMQGQSGNVEAGGSVRLDAQAVEAAGATVSSLRAQAFVSTPGPVALQFTLANGLVYPEDYDALELLSFYSALEKSRAELATWGLQSLVAAPIFDHVDLENESGLSPLAEGELFLEPLNAFFLPSLAPQQLIPPQMNLGAVAHALGVEAWQEVVWQGAPADPAYAVAASDPDAIAAIHVGQSLRLGVGDLFGALLTEDPRWFDHSLPQTSGARDLDQLRCGSSAMLQALGVPDSQVPYDPYPLGTVLAYSLWDTAQNSDPTELATGVVAALPGIAAAQSGNGGKLGLAAALDALAAAASPDVQGTLCGELLDRFNALSITALPTCNSVGVNAPSTSCQ